MNGDQQIGGFDQLMAATRRYGLLIVAFVLLAAGAGFGVSKLQPEKYDATAKLLFRTPSYGQEAVLGTNTPSSTGGNDDPVRQAATNVSLVDLPVVAARTSRSLGGAPPPQEISDSIAVAAEGQSDLVAVAATDAKPARAKLLANQFAREFVAFRAETDRSRLARAKRLAEREYSDLSPDEKEGPRGEALSRAAERLGVLASLQTGNAELVQSARLPRSPSSPKPIRDGIIGGLLGLMIGVGLALLLQRLNRRIPELEETAEETGEIPEPEETGEEFAPIAPGPGSLTDPASQGNGSGESPALPAATGASLSALPAALRELNAAEVVVTSNGAGEGEHEISWQLASGAADSSSVVIVEAGIWPPSMARRHGLQPVPGVTEILTGQVSWREAIQSVTVELDADTWCTFDVLVSGATPSNPAELLNGAEMGYLLASLSGYYDSLILDTDADAFPLFRRVHGATIVVRAGEADRRSQEVYERWIVK